MDKYIREELYKILDVYSPDTSTFLIAKEIIRQLKDEQHLNTVELAKNTYSSKPTITRFAQSFGFEGFLDFKKEVLKQEKVYFFKSDTKNYETSYETYSELICSLLHKFDLQKDMLIKVAKLIQVKKRLFIFSSSENQYLANNFADKFRFLGIQTWNATNNRQFYLGNLVQKDDVAFFLVSGYDNRTLSYTYKVVNKICSTVLLATPSQSTKFNNPDLKVNLEIEAHVLRGQIKEFLITYLLDQIYNLVTNNEQKYIDIYIQPKNRL